MNRVAFARTTAVVSGVILIGLLALPRFGPSPAGRSGDSKDARATPTRGAEGADLPRPTPASTGPVADMRVPLSFERNDGQAPAAVRYLARGRAMTLLLTADGPVLGLRGPAGQPPARLGFELVGGATSPRIEAAGSLTGRSNYFVGDDPSSWRPAVPHFRRVAYRDVYPGVDLVFYGNDGDLEYDFIVAAGADPGSIRMRFEGAREVRIDEDGDLVLELEHGRLVKRAPVIYQESGSGRQRLAGGYVVDGPDVRFEVPAYDREATLVIDPVLVYSTFLGGSQLDFGFAIAIDGSGYAYVTGTTPSADFPTAGSPFDDGFNGGSPFGDAFVAKLSPDGQRLIWATYLGGAGDDQALAIAVDAGGNAHVTGRTGSTDFPTTPGAFQPSFAGGSSMQFGGDAFVTKLNAAGSALLYSTYLGGAENDEGHDIALAPTGGTAYVVGGTLSAGFVTTAGVFQPGCAAPGCNDGFITALSSTGARVWASFLGGSGNDGANAVAVDTTGRLLVGGSTSSSNFPGTMFSFQEAFAGGGRDGFVAAVTSGGTAVSWASYLGGTDDDGTESVDAVATDPSRNVYVTGETTATDFPTTPGAFQTVYGGPGPFGGGDGFAARINAAGDTLVYSTYLGGASVDSGEAIDVDGTGRAVVVGTTFSTDFPTVVPIQAALAGQGDAFVSWVDTSGSSLIFSTFLGGGLSDRGNGVALDGAGNAFLTGGAPAGFPTTPGAVQTINGGSSDAFVAKIGPLLRFFMADAGQRAAAPPSSSGPPANR
jgi:hypothetical protein